MPMMYRERAISGSRTLIQPSSHHEIDHLPRHDDDLTDRLPFEQRRDPGIAPGEGFKLVGRSVGRNQNPGPAASR